MRTSKISHPELQRTFPTACNIVLFIGQITFALLPTIMIGGYGLDSTTTSSLVKLVSPSLKGAKSGILWLWVRSQATAESFPIFFTFFVVAVARRVAFVPFFSSFTSSTFTVSCCRSPPSSACISCPAVTADLLPCVALAFRAFPSACLRFLPSFVRYQDAPLC